MIARRFMLSLCLGLRKTKTMERILRCQAEDLRPSSCSATNTWRDHRYMNYSNWGYLRSQISSLYVYVLYIYMCVCVCVCMHACVYAYIHTICTYPFHIIALNWNKKLRIHLSFLFYMLSKDFCPTWYFTWYCQVKIHYWFLCILFQGFSNIPI